MRTYLGIYIASAAAFLYIMSLVMISEISTSNSPRIHSQSQLEQMLETEKKRLKCDKII